MSSTHRILFIHIPKTGGTSLARFLDDRYAAHEIFTKEKIQEVPDLDFRNHESLVPFVKAYPLVHEHFGASFLEHFPEYNILTVLRDPRARLVSYYNDLHTKSEANMRTASAENRDLILQAKRFDLEGFLHGDSVLVKKKCLDHMVRVLGGSDIPIEDAYENAIELLKKPTTLFGFTEELETFAQELRDFYDWKYAEFGYQLNTSRGSILLSNITKKADSLLSEHIQWDLKLYEEAKRIYEKKMKGKNFKKSDHKLTSIHLSMRDPLQGRNWHEREFDDKGNAWRWTGPEKGSEIRCDIPAGKMDVLVSLISTPGELDARDIQLILGRDYYSPKYIMLSEGKMKIHFHAETRMRIQTLSIFSPVLFSHFTLGESLTDKRVKGLAITDIIINVHDS